MNKKTIWAVVIVIVVVVAVGGFFAMHKTTKKNTTTSSSTTSSATKIDNSVMVSANKSGVGDYLTDPSKHTLYTYGSDTSGVSNCTSSCLAAWPAYVDKGATTGLPTNISTITRADNGDTQYTYKGMPLYYFASDSAGQVTGNGVGGFIVAKP